MVIRWLFILALLWVAWRLVRARLTPPGSQPGRPTGQSGADPYAVLGVPRGTSGVELQQAYRERMKEYHPDRVADLGPELRELAHRKTVEIQRAWDALRPKDERR